MDVTELSREQLVELKQNYLCSLADSGDYSEVLMLTISALAIQTF